MRPARIVLLGTALSVALVSACEPTDQNEPPGSSIRDRDASALDAGHVDVAHLDAGPAAKDASTEQASDATSDAADASSSPHLAQLSQSRASWQALRAASPGAYWYAEENCAANSVQGSVEVVQVESNMARDRGAVAIPRSSCEALVDRYGRLYDADGKLRTMEQLYDLCEAQLRREPASNFAVDARGVIKACWYRQLSNCLDSCGSGFYLRDVQFGLAPMTFDAGTPRDGGILTDAGH